MSNASCKASRSALDKFGKPLSIRSMTAEDAAAIRWTNLCGSLSHNARWQSFRHAASFERMSLMESFKGRRGAAKAFERFIFCYFA
jgi:hypothetical protein